MVQNVLTQLCANINKIFAETFLHPQIWDLKYLLMCKLQYLDTIHNLMNKFHMERKSSNTCKSMNLNLKNDLHYIGDTLWQTKLFDNFINLTR